MAKANVYGPRPQGAGYRCKDCGSDAYPLFGHTVAGSMSDETRCSTCLERYGRRRARYWVPSQEARIALERAGSRIARHPEEKEEVRR